MSNQTKKIDTINIALMVFSFLMARALPFEMFLFSYIILGPLHYMTEISWLRERSFFASNKSWLYVLIIFGLVGGLVNTFLGFQFLNGQLLEGLTFLLPLLLLGGFFVAILTQSKKITIRAGFLFLGAFLFLVYFLRLEYFLFLLVLFIPTLIHTTIFTGNFILEGALKNKSLIGFLSFLVFIICNLGFFIFSVDPKPLVNPFVQNLFLESNFYQINLNLNYLIYGTDGSTFVLDSTIGTRIQGFIAFAYTYHYLNWFSKTEVIKWHKIPRTWLLGSVGIWIASIVLHLINIKAGITFIALLSTLHVYSEFPLNHKSFVNVGKMLTGFKKSEA